MLGKALWFQLASNTYLFLYDAYSNVKTQLLEQHNPPSCSTTQLPIFDVNCFFVSGENVLIPHGFLKNA